MFCLCPQSFLFLQTQNSDSVQSFTSLFSYLSLVKALRVSVSWLCVLVIRFPPAYLRRHDMIVQEDSSSLRPVLTQQPECVCPSLPADLHPNPLPEYPSLWRSLSRRALPAVQSWRDTIENQFDVPLIVACFF